MSNPTKKELYAYLKLQALRLATNRRVSYYDALDDVAQDYGFRGWKEANHLLFLT